MKNKVKENSIDLSNIIVLEYGNNSDKPETYELESAKVLRKHPNIFCNYNH
jgi:hypothetical protein